MDALCVGAVRVRAQRGEQNRYCRARYLGAGRIDGGVGEGVVEPVLEVEV